MIFCLQIATNKPSMVVGTTLMKEITEAGLQEGETSIFSHKASLMLVNRGTNSWEDKGSGQLNVRHDIHYL